MFTVLCLLCLLLILLLCLTLETLLLFPSFLPHISLALKSDSTHYIHWAKKATIHQVTTMLATSKNILFPAAGHNYLLTTGADDPSL